MFRVIVGLGLGSVVIAVGLWLLGSVLVFFVIPILAVLFGALGL